MFQSFTAAALVATSLAYSAPTQAERDSVKEWDTIMKTYGRDYEIHTTTTGDSWELTLFRIMPSDPSKATGRSVFFQHGLGQDAESWLQSTYNLQEANSTDIPAMLTLADEGYDVWMGNNRGTKYSNVNKALPYADDISFGLDYVKQNFKKYDYSWAEMGKYDVPAFLDKVVEVSGNQKVTYVGYSQGTTQMLYALSTQEEVLAPKLDKAVLLAPAVYVTAAGLDFYNAIFPVMRHEFVNAFNRPYYWNSDIRNICEPTNITDFMADDREYACEFAKACTGMEKASLKSYEHFNQIGITQRWQEYVKDFSAETAEGTLITPGFSSIKNVPIQIVTTKLDELCPIDGVDKLRQELGDAVQLYTDVPQADSHSWYAQQAASPEFTNLVRTQVEYVKPVPVVSGALGLNMAMVAAAVIGVIA